MKKGTLLCFIGVALIFKEFSDTMEIKGSVNNLLDKDSVDPALPALPDDEPQPGMTCTLVVNYKFQSEPVWRLG